MKNAENFTLGRVIMIPLDEFRELVERLTDGLKTVEYEFGIYYSDTEKAEKSDVYWNQYITETLSEYFGVEVTSAHADDGEPPLVYVIYREQNQ